MEKITITLESLKSIRGDINKMGPILMNAENMFAALVAAGFAPQSFEEGAHNFDGMVSVTPTVTVTVSTVDDTFHVTQSFQNEEQFEIGESRTTLAELFSDLRLILQKI